MAQLRDPHEQLAMLHRLHGATLAYCELLERGRLVARELAGAGEEKAGYLADSIGVALDAAGAEMGTPAQLHHALRGVLGMGSASDYSGDGQ